MIWDHIILGLAQALTADNLLYCFIGVFLGTLLGVIPGIGTLIAVSLLFPFTFHLQPTTALIMLAGIYYGTSYGGSTASILLGLPGTPSNAVIVADGHAMAKKGRAGQALFLTGLGSFVGGSTGIILMMLFAPLIASVGLSFTAPEYFSLMLFGLVAASSMSSGAPAKGLGMVALGLLLGTVGLDVQTGSERLTFGFPQLFDGVSLVIVALGLFGIAEVMASATNTGQGEVFQKKITMRALIPSKEERQRSVKPMIRGSLIGSFFGMLPGTGGLLAAFMAYLAERRFSKNPEEFGYGAVEGVVAPETANNAADQTAFIPTMTLGIPGSASMALMLGVLIIHGITPGPRLVVEQPALFWGLIMSFWIGNIMLLILNIPLIGIWVKLLSVPYRLLYPAVLLFCCFGVYSATGQIFDVWLALGFGLLGYLMKMLEMPAAPLLLGLVLGPMMEDNFRRALLISRGDLLIFVERPISAGILLLCLGMLLVTFVGHWRAGRRLQTEETR